MRERAVRPGATFAAAAATFALLAGVASAAPRSKAFVPTTNTILQAMAGALGGSARIAKIDTIYFEWHVLGVQIRNGSQQAIGGVRTHQRAREWFTAAGDDRMEALTAAMQGAPVLRVFLSGTIHESLSIVVTDSGRYVRASNVTKCSSASGGLCVEPTEIDLDTAASHVRTSARIDVTESGYKGSFSESDTCAGIASIVPVGKGNAPAVFSVAPSHPGRCTVTFSSSSPQGWLLEGDQGSPSGDSTGALQGRDLSREMSYVYWMTFAYLHAGALPGSIRYVPIRGADEYELNMQPQGGEPIVATINEATFLPDKIQIGSDPFEMIVIPSAWKATDGVLFPMKMTVDLFDAEMQMEYSLDKVQLNEKFNPSLFTQPVPSI